MAAATLAGLLDVAEEVAAAVLGAAVAEEVAVVAQGQVLSMELEVLVTHLL